MLTISLFWFGVLVLMGAVLGYLAGTTHTKYIAETKYVRGAEDAAEAFRTFLLRVEQEQTTNDNNDDNETKAQMGFDITQKGETE